MNERQQKECELALLKEEQFGLDVNIISFRSELVESIERPTSFVGLDLDRADAILKMLHRLLLKRHTIFSKIAWAEQVINEN